MLFSLGREKAIGHFQASQSGGGFGFWQDTHSPRVNRLHSIFKVKLIHCRFFCVKRRYNLRKCLDLKAPQLSAEQRLATGLAWWWIWCISIMSTADFRIKRNPHLSGQNGQFEALNEWNTEEWQEDSRHKTTYRRPRSEEIIHKNRSTWVCTGVPRPFPFHGRRRVAACSNRKRYKYRYVWGQGSTGCVRAIRSAGRSVFWFEGRK